MAAYLLHYRELDGRRVHHVNKCAALYELKTLTVDTETPGLGDYPSVRSALADPDLGGYSWCWLHPQGEVYLDEYEHPQDRVVYCLGHDTSGFGDLLIGEMPGAVVRLRAAEHEEWRASAVAASVCYDRMLYLAGRRR